MANQENQMQNPPRATETRPIRESGTGGQIGVSSQPEVGHGLNDATKTPFPVETAREDRPGGFIPEFLRNMPDIVPAQEDPAEGEGEFYVVTVDALIGADGVAFTKGDVRRLSKFINNYGDEKHRDEVYKAFQRLEELKAIRPADLRESEQSKIDIDKVDVIDARQEQLRRIAAEQELEQYKKMAAQATQAQQKASPAQTGDKKNNIELPKEF